MSAIEQLKLEQVFRQRVLTEDATVAMERPGADRVAMAISSELPKRYDLTALPAEQSSKFFRQPFHLQSGGGRRRRFSIFKENSVCEFATRLAPIYLALLATFSLPSHAQFRLSASSAPSESAIAASALASPTEPSGVLTLQAAIALAQTYSPELQIFAREYDATEGAVIQGGARPNPHATYQLEDTRRETRTTTVGINLPVELGGKRQARIDAAQKLREVAAADLAGRRQEIRASAISLFFDVLVGQERVRLAEDSVNLAQRATDVTSKRVTAGRVSPVEETRARVAQAGAQLEYVQARSDLNAARQRLVALWGSRAPQFERADGNVEELPTLPAADQMQRRLERSPNIRRAEIEVERRKALTDLERARRVPDLTLTVGTKRPEELGRNQLVFGVAIPIPILDTNRGNIYEAARREDKARDELLASRVRLNAEILLARERLVSARNELDLLRNTVLPGAISAYDAATRGYELGRFQFLEVLDAQRTLFQAKAQYLRSIGEAHRSAAEIDRLLGDEQIVQEKKQ